MATVIAIAIEKGGAGKTTTTVNLAALMAQDGKRVLVVDMDAQANATFMLTAHDKDEEIYKNKGLFDMLRRFDPEEMSLDKFIHPSTVPGVDVIPSNAATPQAVGQLGLLAEAYGEADYRFLAYCLAVVADRYDFILLDTPPARDLLTRSALFAADEVLMPFRCETFNVQGLKATLKIIDTLERQEDMKINLLGILYTQVERTVANSLIDTQLRESEFGEYIFHTGIRKGSAVAESILVAQPVVLYAKGSNPSRDYRAVYEEIKQRLAAREG